ncbi:hypothetical protein [Paenibacillus stellifer]|uniref:hypothetical protein n=1 Tax=Paenibacillus stellifer TaxID=169760 RepID=UPI000691CDA4|nr:hypothetical protein [Paenibacillus stellifer]
MNKKRLQLSDIKRVIITYQDIDHIGNLFELSNLIPELELLAHADDIPYLTGDLPFIKFTRERIEMMPGPAKDMALHFLESWRAGRSPVCSATTADSTRAAPIH